MSTTSRILIAFLGLLALGLLLLERQLASRVQRQYFEAIEEPMVDMAHLFATLLEQQVHDDGTIDVTAIRRSWKGAGEREFSARIYNVIKTKVNAQIYVTDRRGVVLFDSDGGRAEGEYYGERLDVHQTLAGKYGARATRVDPADEDSVILFVGAPIWRAGEIIGMASVSKPVASVLPFRDATRVWMRNLSLAFLVLVTTGAYFIVTHFSRPIRQLTDYAYKVARGERASLPRGGTTEVATLARAFEEMRDALDGRSYVQNYVETLTHEMKSPVAAIRGAAELLREDSMAPEDRKKFLDNIQAEAGRLQTIIDRLLGLTAIESRKALDHPEPVAITELVEAVRRQLQPAADARGVRIELEGDFHLMVTGEYFLLEIAVANLLQNAIDFSPSGSGIRIHVAPASDGPWVELKIEDQGPGIPDYALPRLFERFYSLSRPDSRRKSSGLGLCFVREAVELHHGTVTVVNRPDAPGACATLRLPLDGAETIRPTG